MFLAIPVLLRAAPPEAARQESASEPRVLMGILEKELLRNFQILTEKGEPPPYFISYQVVEERVGSLSGSNGALEEQPGAHRRRVDCSVRVGSPELDNYHPLDGNRPRAAASALLPVEDRPEAIQLILWRETDRAWRAAADRLIRVRTSARNDSDDAPADFSKEEPSNSVLPAPPLRVERDEWSSRLKRVSAELGKASGILSSEVSLTWRQEAKTLVTTEGTRVHHGGTNVRVVVLARAKASDGEDLLAMESFEAADFSGLPKESVLLDTVRKIQNDLKKLLLAPPADPYAGPAILSGAASAVFFHEIFGHRIEGHRQSDRREGQTWSNSINTEVLPDFLSVTFDPTRKEFRGTDLNGHYAFDDEGVPAQRVEVVDKGVLRTFLMSRSPIKNISNSNGHGRKQAGLEVVARQSNLLVQSTRTASDKQLRQMLIEEAKKQGKPYGLFFDKVTGGYTLTRRTDNQVFTVQPLIVYKIFTDGKPDQLVRGVAIVGTPLASFAKIMATGDRPEIFNGYCGAESGSIPVAAVSPALLVSEIEIQRKAVPSDRPPLQPAPTAGGGL